MASGPAAPPAQAPPQPPRRARISGRAYLSVVLVLMLAVGLLSYLAVRHRQQDDQLLNARPSGIPASISTALANLMQLSPVPGKAAPGFTLTDQAGRTLSLASFRGHAVVLEFMDPHCTDICPIVSHEFTDAYHDLGAAASRVVFLAVNVNPYHAKVTDMAAYSAEQGLTAVPSWHFFTGQLAALRAVWASYGVQVDAPGPNADVIHTSIVYFIDPSGHERFIAAPMDDHTANGTAYLPAGQLTSWGHGIALAARQLAG
jgi:cytochrome oxidase Cu insertion factor (SCO1/SenC/PrrC family)